MEKRVKDLEKATELDLVSSSELLIDTENGTKGLPANLLAKASDLYTPIDLNDSKYWLSGGINATTGKKDITAAQNRLSTIHLELLTTSSYNFTRLKNEPGITITTYCYDENENYLGFSTNLTAIIDVVKEYPTAKKFRLSLLNVLQEPIPTNINNIVTFVGNAFVIDFVSNEDLEEFKETITTNGNVLFGKKWVACGDSFTQGVTDKFTEGKYVGKNKSYPYYVGLRNYMEVINLAVGGSTISYIEGVSNEENSFTYPATGKLYQIPSDVDYITLKFGINDSHKNVPIGTIDDTTNTTLYGAWNFTLEYLITNFPFAKIGVIVSNGCDTEEYSRVARDCAERWGIAYLDENFDYKVPLLHRVNGKPKISSTAKTLRYNQFKVSDSDGHPNAKAMEFESTFVENFLRSL